MFNQKENMKPWLGLLVEWPFVQLLLYSIRTVVVQYLLYAPKQIQNQVNHTPSTFIMLLCIQNSYKTEGYISPVSKTFSLS